MTANRSDVPERYENEENDFEVPEHVDPDEVEEVLDSRYDERYVEALEGVNPDDHRDEPPKQS